MYIYFSSEHSFSGFTPYVIATTHVEVIPCVIQKRYLRCSYFALQMYSHFMFMTETQPFFVNSDKCLYVINVFHDPNTNKQIDKNDSLTLTKYIMTMF